MLCQSSELKCYCSELYTILVSVSAKVKMVFDISYPIRSLISSVSKRLAIVVWSFPKQCVGKLNKIDENLYSLNLQ